MNCRAQKCLKSATSVLDSPRLMISLVNFFTLGSYRISVSQAAASLGLKYVKHFITIIQTDFSLG